MTENVLNRFRLDGRTAIITGVGPGIGAHVAQAYAEVGANVVVTARTPGKAESVAEEIQKAGGNALGLTSDCGKVEDLESLVKQTKSRYGSAHILFHNAFVGPIDIKEDIWAATDDVWEQAIAVNMLAPYRLAKMLVPDMKKEGYGSIINLLTCAAFTPILPQIAYGSTKAALHMMTRYLAKAVGPEVRANCICPGSMSPDGAVREAFAKHVQSNAIARTGLADEVVGAALLLASPASSYTTGQVTFCEGGRIGTIS